MKRLDRKAQSLLEYSIILGVIASIMVTMNPLIRRGIQGMVKVVADQIGNQVDADQRAFGSFNSVTNTLWDQGGYLESTYGLERTRSEKDTEEAVGVTKYIYDEEIATITNATINLGFTEKPD